MELNEKQFHIRIFFLKINTENWMLYHMHYLKIRKVPGLNTVTYNGMYHIQSMLKLFPLNESWSNAFVYALKGEDLLILMH